MVDDEAAAGSGHHAVIGTQFKTDKTDTKEGASLRQDRLCGCALYY
jgi:hypothetical protein